MNRFRWFAPLFLALLVGVAAPFSASRSEPAKTLEEQQKAARLKDLGVRIADLQKELERKFTTRSRLEKELEQSEKKILADNLGLQELDDKLQQQDQELTRLRLEQARQKEGLARHQTLLQKQAVMGYLAGREEYLKLLLNQQEPGAIPRMMEYYRYFHLARNQEMTILQDQLQNLQSLEQDIRRGAEQLAETRLSLVNRQRSLEEQRSKRQQLLADLRQQISSGEQRLSRMQLDEQRLRELLDGLRRYMQDLPPDTPQDIARVPGGKFSASSGKMNWPVRGGKAVARFGQARDGGAPPWQGVLINAPAGSTVSAIHAGRVAFADWLRGFGQLLIIDHGEGYMSLYAYNQQLLKKTGERVKAGEPVAKVGDSGGQNHAGLYFEVRHNGKPKNPALWCRS